MQTVVVDTDVVSYLFKQDTRAILYQPHLLQALPAISFMTLAERERWALVKNWGMRRRLELSEFLQSYVVVLPDATLCRTWAEVVEQVQQSGGNINTADAWIAATALYFGVPLVAHNRKDYAAVQGLTIISEAP